MEISTTKCCAIMEIHNLRVHRTPEEAMTEFCKLNIASTPRFGTGGNVPRTGSIYAFYLFTAECNFKGGPPPGGGSYGSGAYGTNFAKFIEENGLGKVWTSPVKPNQVFHPDHFNQIWVWDVNHEALKKWWKRKTEATTKKETYTISPKIAPPEPLYSCGANLEDGCNEEFDNNEDDIPF